MAYTLGTPSDLPCRTDILVVPDECQNNTLLTSSSSISVPVLKCKRLFYHLRHEGLASAADIVASAVRRRVEKLLQRAGHAHDAKPLVKVPPLHLVPGELVEVKSAEEIAQTLDENRCSGGLMFMPQMWKLCGKRLRVFKLIRQIVVENRGGVRKLSGTVILESALCDGGDIQCDRTCFFFWREAWLKRVVENSTPATLETPKQLS